MPSETSALWMRRLPYVVVTGLVLLILTILLPAIQRARETARQGQSKNNLRQIGLALQTYADGFKTLPPGGTFDAAGVAHHGWTTFLDIYLAQSAFITFVDFNVPWDDPRNVDLFLQGPFLPVWRNPSIREVTSTDGFPISHYAANQWIMHRNSSVRIDELHQGTSSTAIVGEACGSYDPLGYPYQWRDLTLGLGKSHAGFGGAIHNRTMFLMADASIWELSNATDNQIIQRMLGSLELKPSSAQVARPDRPYRLKTHEYWKFLRTHRCGKTWMSLRLSPDGKTLKVDFADCDPGEEINATGWLMRFLAQNKSVEHAELRGKLRAIELIPFLELPKLNRLTISDAQITGEKESVLATARRDLEID